MTCDSIAAVVIGGGKVGTRKALALHDAGATVRVISPDVTGELVAAASSSDRLSIEPRAYLGSADLAGVEVVIAATGTDVDLQVGDDARALHLLVSVASAPSKGNFTSMAVHRTGTLAIGVSAGSLPRAAGSIRDAIARRFDERYATAISACTEVRSAMLARNGSEAWAIVNESLAGDDFCGRVESGALMEALGPCR